ncbi:hypothetical protein FRC06_004112, partial [Ceratobasidium sp. 370]
MDGRPALPPEHPSWEQERDNIIKWFILLHVWQGGNEGPNWYLIQNNVHSQKYEMVDKVRLPVAHIPLAIPDDWNENMTRTWSKHLQRCTDDFGCVMRSHTGTVFQFRTLIDEDEQPSRIDIDFRDECWDTHQVEFGMAALMYAERVARERQAVSASATNDADRLYPETASHHVHLAAKYVPVLDVVTSPTTDTTMTTTGVELATFWSHDLFTD